jgi:hypothetical protein
MDEEEEEVQLLLQRNVRKANAKSPSRPVDDPE